MLRILKHPWPIINFLGLCFLAVVITTPFELELLFHDTILTGGDGGSWHQIALHLKESLIPNGRLFGWDQGNFFGYSNLQHYFVLPFFISVLLSYILPLTVALKLVTVSGFFLMPFAVYWALRKIGYKNPIPLSGAWIVLVFLFHERYNMFGGNFLSTLAGEFCYSIAFTLFVVYIALLLDDVKKQTLSVKPGLFLGLIGLSHAFVFFVAVLMPIYFLCTKPSRITIKIILINYLLGFLIMAFWVLPMISNLSLTTPISLIWRFPEIFDFLNSMVYEVVFVALAISLFFVKKSNRSIEGGFFLFGILVSFILYVVATALHIPDIRFFPPLLFFSTLLIINGISLLLTFNQYHRLMSTISVMGLSILFGSSWVFTEGNQAKDWFSWNYSGYEAKPAFLDGRAAQIFSSLKGSYTDPRVAWEQGKHADDFGTARVFENIPLFTGRASTEGIHYASGLLSLAVTTLHGEYSKSPSSPSAYIHSHYFIGSLPERFEMLNIRDFIAFSPVVTELMMESSEFDVAEEVPPYTLFRWNKYDSSYVVSPKYTPLVIYDSPDWKRKFNSWFRRGDNLDLTILSGAQVNSTMRQKHFSGPYLNLNSVGMVEGVHRKPLEPALIENVKIQNFKIEFKTDKPNTPHIIKISYSDNWKSLNSESIFMVAPGFMMIYPTSNDVQLIYTRHWSEYLGLFFSFFGFLLVIYFSIYKEKISLLFSSPYLEQVVLILESYRTPLLIGLGLIILFSGIWSFQGKQGVHENYVVGTNLSQAGRLDDALHYFKLNGTLENILSVDDVDVPVSIYSAARLYLRIGKPKLAKLEFEKIIKYYPRWMFINEIYAHLGFLAVNEKRFEDAAYNLEKCIEIENVGVYAERCKASLQKLDEKINTISESLNE